MSLFGLPEEIITNIIDNIGDYNLYIFRTVNRDMNRILNIEINIRSLPYGGQLGLKYNIIYDNTMLSRNNILENIGDKNNTYIVEYWTKTRFRVFGLGLLKNSICVSIWLNI